MEYQPHSLVAPSTSTLSLETRIALLARTLWEDYGRPDDCDVAIWMEAERRVLRMIESLSELASGVVPTFRQRIGA